MKLAPLQFSKRMAPCRVVMQLPRGITPRTLEPLQNSSGSSSDYNDMLKRIYAAIRPGPKVRQALNQGCGVETMKQ